MKYQQKRSPDPQVSWQVLHKSITGFLQTVPAAQKLVVKGEDLLMNSGERLLEVLTWLGLRVVPQTELEKTG